MQYFEEKKLIRHAIGKVVTNLRGDKSKFMLGAENDISTSILSNLENGKKDPQLTTIFKLAEAFNMKASDFIKLVEKNLPKNFSLIIK
ncbi:MAG: helix-turn-helix transcriptional regulator [Candidatus Gastranaerophilaceae bacterium]